VTPTTRDATKETALPEDSLGEPLDSLSIELGRISAEIQSINSGFQAQMQQVLAETREAIEKQYRTRFEKNLAEMRGQVRLEVKEELEKDFQQELEARVAHRGDVKQEIDRVAAKLEGVAKEIVAMLDDPSVELSKVMRKRTEQAELKAYLNGLRFSIGDSGKAKAAGA
jgi:hypothetical protein